MSEEKGGGSTGYTSAQIGAAKRERDAAARFLNGFKNQFTKSSGSIYKGPDSANNATAAMSQVKHYESGIRTLYNEANDTYNRSVTAKHTNEEGRSFNTYNQAQINAFRATRDKAQRGLQFVVNVKTKMTDDIEARNRVTKAQSEIKRLAGNLVTVEANLAKTDVKVNDAQNKVNAAKSSLNSAKAAIQAAEQKK